MSYEFWYALNIPLTIRNFAEVVLETLFQKRVQVFRPGFLTPENWWPSAFIVFKALENLMKLNAQGLFVSLFF